MVAEIQEMSNGWPLGLQTMSTRLRVVDSLQSTTADPSTFHMHSISFSSFTSSELNTESTKSFFQDRSVSLGWLIGLRPQNGEELCLTNSHLSEDEQVSGAAGATTDMTSRRQMKMSECICVPLLLNVLVRTSRSKNNSRHQN
ncbi:uncharacterized protein LOC122653025 [Telopea speciosissima]|uniref:uncharacterized protein LOC122653025 n=1 Tax=Telopea speciosissima TaxID=54955 RepID=UPI001CC6A990|nr:uncharacterized protein LOC122653025 [Telopea speciosissima]